MIVFLYIISILFCFNHALLILGLYRLEIAKKHIHIIIRSGSLIILLIGNLFFESWKFLVLIYSIYLFYLVLEMIIKGIKKSKKPSYLIPINIFTLFLSIIAYVSELWLIFIVGYILNWLLTFIISKISQNERKELSYAKASRGKSNFNGEEFNIEDYNIGTSSKDRLNDFYNLNNLVNPILNFLANVELDKLLLHKKKENLRRTPIYLENSWVIEIKILEENVIASKIGYLIWAISTAFELNDNFKNDSPPTLIDWGNGSKWFKLRINFPNKKNKQEAVKLLKEAKNILLKGKESAEAFYLDKPVKEVEQLTEETKKTSLEGEQIKQTLYTEEQAEELKELNIEEKKIQLELLRQSLIEKKLNNLEKGAELLATGLLSHKEVKFLINGQTYLSAENGKWKEETSIEEIAAKEIEDLIDIED